MMARALVALALACVGASVVPAWGAPTALGAPTAPAAPGRAGSLVLSPSPPSVRFSHRAHDARGITCLRCHPQAASSRSAVDLLLPTEAECRACHPVERGAADAEACGKCHLGSPSARVAAAPPALKHSHAAHAALPCARCHATAADDSARPGLPDMASCMSCHLDGARANRCTACHLATPSGALDVGLGRSDGPRLLPSGARWGDAHLPGFAGDHRAAARRPDRVCSACHEESTCDACHQGASSALAFHPPEYLRVHAIDARRASTDCGTCHRAQTFCVGCHQRVGVGTGAASEWRAGQGPGGGFHPVGWASSERGRAENLHAREARRNLTACTSCHREDECLPCHSADAGGLRVTPHPPGWRGSARCRALDRANRRMCLRCHVTDDELGCDWRAAAR